MVVSRQVISPLCLATAVGGGGLHAFPTAASEHKDALGAKSIDASDRAAC